MIRSVLKLEHLSGVIVVHQWSRGRNREKHWKCQENLSNYTRERRARLVRVERFALRAWCREVQVQHLSLYRAEGAKLFGSVAFMRYKTLGTIRESFVRLEEYRTQPYRWVSYYTLPMGFLALPYGSRSYRTKTNTRGDWHHNLRSCAPVGHIGNQSTFDGFLINLVWVRKGQSVRIC